MMLNSSNTLLNAWEVVNDPVENIDASWKKWTTGGDLIYEGGESWESKFTNNGKYSSRGYDFILHNWCVSHVKHAEFTYFKYSF